MLVKHPGPWQQYVRRPDNVNLDIMTVKNKYLREQMDYERTMVLYMQSQQMGQVAGASQTRKITGPAFSAAFSDAFF